MFIAGDKVGPYVLVRRLGDGGFGDVWLAEKSGLITTRFALKLPKNEDIDSEAFRTEAAVWAQATGHTNIVPIISADTHSVNRGGVTVSEGQTVIVSEYITGGSLQDRVNTTHDKFLDPEAALEMMIGILAGLDFLHTRTPRIIHRDLKPENVLLQGETPRLTDFGISSVLQSTSSIETQQIAGTFPYMAPEVFDGRFSARSDIWAAGVVLYKLISGRLPFYGDGVPATIRAIISDPVPPLSPTVPWAIIEIIEKALAKSADDRYRTTADMRSALIEARRHVSGTPEVIPPTVKVPIVGEQTTDVITKLKERFAEEGRRKPRPFLKYVGLVLAILLGLFIVGKVQQFPVITPIPTPTPGSNVVAGKVEFETVDKAITTNVGGKITKWLFKPGDFMESCLLSETKIADTANFATGQLDLTMKPGSVILRKPEFLKSITVDDGSFFAIGDELAKVSVFEHAWVNAQISAQEAARIKIGTTATFTTDDRPGIPGTKFHGSIQSTDVATGKIRVKLDDTTVWHPVFQTCLLLEPSETGKVSFDF
ncbi:MAG: protein kinase [Acidobacteriota bacterium]